MREDGKKALVLVERLYNELELFVPYYRLQEADLQVALVGPKAGETYQGKSGIPVQSDVSPAEARAADYDVVIIPGGYAPDYLRRDEDLVSLVAEAVAANKIVGAICHAGWMLASAQVLQGKRVTSAPSIRHDLENAGATWIDCEVVVDAPLVTSRSPDDLPAFLKTILRLLAS